MKKISILSDTHLNLSAIETILPILKESDYVIHLGDHYTDMDAYERILGSKLYRVNGNCDYGKLKEIELEIEGNHIFATHGDLYSVKSTKIKLVQEAKKRNCNIALFGHTHVSEIETIDGVLIINPGCMTRYASKSFCYLVINGAKAVPVIHQLENY